ncbi:hypothetical protein QH639_20100 [Lysinibacillus sp. 1 U-2021]|uniref:hypothetical protein n=1 Tax=Lysinibacillus sp. 1 U-2021 TaxID=3039426 RepID=UPI00247FA4FE|nr:hypothetical protein [Lysinibacillus sp. 1 U-2021]WGT38102.1 hypothetical protein QH639_20100 [Lysinibacillus sp. 1 U-2021]
MNDEKVHFKCGYTYMKKGKEKSATYISPKVSQNFTNPNVIASKLANEIFVNTGRTVKTFMFVGKEPVKND